METSRLGLLVRAVRIRKGLRQTDLAVAARVSQAAVSRLERGQYHRLNIDAAERIASVLGVRTELAGRWQGGDGDRLLNWRHSSLGESVSRSVLGHAGWTVAPEVTFSIYGERGAIDQMWWHAASAHMAVVELKTEFADVNEMLGTLDRKARLAARIAADHGWRPKAISVWLIVSDGRTNRRHAANHSTLLRARFPLDGRSLGSFLDGPPSDGVSGMAFWPNTHQTNGLREARPILPSVRRSKTAGDTGSGSRGVVATTIRPGKATTHGK